MTEITPNKGRAKMWIVVINIIVMIIYTLLIRFLNNDAYPRNNLSIGLFIATILAAHIFTCIIVAVILFFCSYKDQAKYWLLSSLLLLLVGFSTCYAMFTIK